MLANVQEVPTSHASLLLLLNVATSSAADANNDQLACKFSHNREERQAVTSLNQERQQLRDNRVIYLIVSLICWWSLVWWFWSNETHFGQAIFLQSPNSPRPMANDCFFFGNKTEQLYKSYVNTSSWKTKCPWYHPQVHPQEVTKMSSNKNDNPINCSVHLPKKHADNYSCTSLQWHWCSLSITNQAAGWLQR